MAFSNSVFSYEDIRQLFDKALASERGLRIKLNKTGAAHNLRQRMSYYRQLDRRENKKIYQPDNPLWGRSQYDVLILKITEADAADTENEAYLDLVKGSADNYNTEEL